MDISIRSTNPIRLPQGTSKSSPAGPLDSLVSGEPSSAQELDRKLRTAALAKPDEKPEWIKTSDKTTQRLLDIEYQESPENGSAQGVASYDTEISVPTAQNEQRATSQRKALLADLQTAIPQQTDTRVRQDFQILAQAVQTDLDLRQYNDEHTVPMLNPADVVVGGISSLLDDQTPASRNAAAVTRLSKYAGLEPGYAPLCDTLKERMLEQMAKPGVTFPSKDEVQAGLDRNDQMLEGLQGVFEKKGLQGWEKPFGEFKAQLDNYADWMRDNVLPKARDSFRLPAEAYLRTFRSQGINDLTPDELAQKAHASFNAIQQQMGVVAGKIASEKHLPSADYRDVMLALKADQIPGDKILPLYHSRLNQIEGIIRDHDIVTLPAGETVIRLATPAEAASAPSPQMVPPPLVDNHGEHGQFVLPLLTADGQRFDDFTYDAMAWPVTAHEARPGHELQFDSMVDRGVSLARAIYADNSANVEGWGLYSESLIEPYMPAEGQLATLNSRLLRSARAFLDPELQSGKTTPDEARKILSHDIGLSPSMVESEISRYTVNAPAQACSYFYGFSTLRGLREDTEKSMGDKFKARDFNDFIVGQGLLPLPLLKQAVTDEFAPKAG